MKKITYLILILVTLISCDKNSVKNQEVDPTSFVTIKGQDLITPDGEKLFIKGTNLGNWLNPEGYMFLFEKTNSARFINDMFCEMVGPDFTKEFWSKFKDNYITYDDIRFIKQTGSNTVRLPFNYKSFTNEDYMGITYNQDGFARIDTLIDWCKKEGLYLILDMHDAPGGQTGDNIDDSYGYPWLFESQESQKLYCDIWKQIADRYKNEPTILGFELLNEPIAHYFDNKEELNVKLPEVYKMGIAAIREVDNNHIILVGGSQWNGNFDPLKNIDFGEKVMYTCHRYGGDPTPEAIQNFIAFRDSANLPMYMGEIGHNTDEWMRSFCKTMEDNNIGWTFWPYKKMNGSSFMGITPPENWDLVVAFSEAPRGTYKEIRDARPNQELTRKAMNDFIEACKFKNNVVQTSYIEALGLNAK